MDVADEDATRVRTELDLNNEQRTACLRHAGAARFAYNFGLRRKAEAYRRARRSRRRPPRTRGACTAN